MDKKGLRIGNYRITPLGLTVIFALVALILALVILIVTMPAKAPDAAKPSGNAVVSVTTPVPTPKPTPVPTATPIPTPTPKPTPRSATICSLGEIAIEEPILKAAYASASGTYDFTEMFSMISDVIGNADFTVADVEGAVGDTKAYAFTQKKISTPSSVLTALKQCGVDMMMLANDHVLDSGWQGAQDSVAKCTANGLAYMGVSLSKTERATPVMHEINGIHVAFLNYTDSLGGKEKNADNAALKYGIWGTPNSNYKNDIAAAKSAGADVILAYMSWGDMFERTPDDDQTAMANALAKAGVDVIIGYNPHVVQPLIKLTNEIDGKEHTTYVLGATGNFLSDRRDKYQDSGVIFRFDIVEQENGSFAIDNLCYVPTYVWRKTLDNGDYAYHTLAVGQWLETQPEGMAYADYTRLKQIWAEVETILGTDIATRLHE